MNESVGQTNSLLLKLRLDCSQPLILHCVLALHRTGDSLKLQEPKVYAVTYPQCLKLILLPVNFISLSLHFCFQLSSALLTIINFDIINLCMSISFAHLVFVCHAHFLTFSVCSSVCFLLSWRALSWISVLCCWIWSFFCWSWASFVFVSTCNYHV